MRSVSEIAERRFSRATFGYKPAEVDDFIDEITAYVNGLTKENEETVQKMLILADKLEEYRSDEESLRSALLGAQKLGDSVIKESKTKAEIILRDATIKAERMIENSQRQIDNEKAALVKIQKEVAVFKNKILNLYKEHLELVSSLPEVHEDDSEAEAGQANQNEFFTAEPEAANTGDADITLAGQQEISLQD